MIENSKLGHKQDTRPILAKAMVVEFAALEVFEDTAIGW